MLKQTLSDLNFSINEQKIIECLSFGTTLSASVIAKHCNIKRPTTYLAIENLIENGYVNRIKKGYTSLFSLIDADLLTTLLENRAERNYSKTKNACVDLKKYLAKNNLPKKSNKFEIQTIQSEDAVYEQLLNVISQNNFDGIFNPQVLFKTLENKSKIKSFLEQTEIKKTKIREILVSGKETDWYIKKINNPNHICKIITKEVSIESDTIITDDFVIISHYSKADDVAIKITHQAYVLSQKNIFNLLWNLL